MNTSRKLIELKNLGGPSVNLLNSVGICTHEDLQTTGSVRAYRQIRQQGIRVSISLLFALEGALLGVPWQSLDTALKAQLVEIAERLDREDTTSDSMALTESA